MALFWYSPLLYSNLLDTFIDTPWVMYANEVEPKEK